MAEHQCVHWTQQVQSKNYVSKLEPMRKDGSDMLILERGRVWGIRKKVKTECGERDVEKEGFL